MKLDISDAEKQKVEDLVNHFNKHYSAISRLGKSLSNLFIENERLPHFIHSIKWRLKDPGHLRDKLYRKIHKAKSNGVAFDITIENMFESINDLVGIRITSSSY